jgi:hypothetical protein
MRLVILLLFVTSTWAQPLRPECKPDPNKYVPVEVFAAYMERSFINGCLQGLATHIISDVTPDMVVFCQTVADFIANPNDPVAKANYIKLFRFKTKGNEI